MKDFKDMWEDAAANSVASGGVSMPADAVKKKKKKDIYDGRTKAGRKFVERIISRRKAAEAKKEVKENVNSDVKKVMPSLEKALKKERIKSLRDIERFFDYDGGDIIFDKIKNQDKANMAIHNAKELLIKKYKLKEDYNQDLTLATKNIARLAKKETGQDQKDYMAVSRALGQGNLGAVKKVIKGISTKEIQSDLLGILVGYNDLIAKMYPKAVDNKGNLKSGLTVSKMIKEETVEEAKKIQDLARKHKRELQKIIKTGSLELSKKAEDELYQWASNNGEIRGDEEDEFWDWIDKNADDLVKGRIKEDVNEAYKFDKNDFRYWRSGGMELKLRNGAYGSDVEQAFKKAGYDVYGRDIDVSRDSIKFNSYSKHWGTDDKKIRKVVLKVLGVDIERL